MTYDEFIEDLYHTTVERSYFKDVKEDEENNQRDFELLDMIFDAVKEKYGAEKALKIINEQSETQCNREYPYDIATFKIAIRIGFMFAKLVYEVE